MILKIFSIFGKNILMFDFWTNFVTSNSKRKLGFQPLRAFSDSVATTTNFLNQKILEIFLRQKTGEITHATLTSPKFTQNRSKLTFHKFSSKLRRVP